jgi:hypothetical protein
LLSSKIFKNNVPLIEFASPKASLNTSTSVPSNLFTPSKLDIQIYPFVSLRTQLFTPTDSPLFTDKWLKLMF